MMICIQCEFVQRHYSYIKLVYYLPLISPHFFLLPHVPLFLKKISNLLTLMVCNLYFHSTFSNLECEECGMIKTLDLFAYSCTNLAVLEEWTKRYRNVDIGWAVKYKLNDTGFNTYNTSRSREGKDNERRGKKKKMKRGRMNALTYLQMNTMIIVNTE